MLVIGKKTQQLLKSIMEQTCDEFFLKSIL